jgi:hypothetical protein
MIPEEVAAVIIVNEYPLRIVWGATSLLQNEVVTVHAIKVYEFVKAELHSFLNSALGVGECSASRLCYFTSGKKTLFYPFNRKLFGPRAGLEYLESEKLLLLLEVKT